MKFVFFTMLATTVLGLAQTYNESGGLVVMETENTPSALGLWQKESSLNTHTGSGYLRFLGNTFETGPATSPLEYTFKINRAGLYYLHLRCAKEIHDGRNDVANDCYVRVEGDYNAGPGPYNSHGDNASLSLLQSNTKYFGGAVNSWKWENGQNSSGSAGNLDPGGHNNKRVAVYDFKAGETYKLVVSGRSKFFRLDRIVFRHTNTSAATAQSLSTPESATISGETSYIYDATEDFPNITGGDVPYYKDNGNDVLAIAANVVANRVGFARASHTFDGPTGVYDVTITTMTEEDGESIYRLLVNGTKVATYTNPFVYDPPDSPLDLQPNTHTWRGISIPNGATIAIESNADTNGEIPEADGTAWARGRWQQIEVSTGSTLIKPPVGRIAIVADGNSPDPDDIGATAVIFGILKGANLGDRLVHLSHSCDLDPFRNGGSQSIDAPNELRRQNKLHALCGEGVGFYGPFPNLVDYYNCRTEQTAAVNDLRDAINASSASDPLWIIEAGEPDIIGYALQAANASARQHVHIVSHHPANDNSGDYFTWQQILDFGVTEHQIGDQNVGLQVLISSGLWTWAENHPDPEIVWILDQLKYAEADGVVGFQDNKYDCSDAGMVYWWITGANNGGNRNSTPVEIREMLLYEPNQGVDLDRPVAHWKLDEGSGIVAGDASGNGHNGTLSIETIWRTDATRGAHAEFNGTDERISTPFRYALSSSDDFTWAWWANQQSTGTTDDGAIMVGNRYPSPGAGGETYEFIKLTPTHGQFANTNPPTSEIERYDYGAIEQGTWNHYAMVKNGTTYQWYINGVPLGSPTPLSETINYNEDTPIPFFIGGDPGASSVNEHFEGFIDDVVLYQKSLSPGEVVDVMNGIYFPAPPVTEVLAGWDTWDNGLTPPASVLASDVTASAVTASDDPIRPWTISDGRGASNDGDWGTFAGPPAPSTVAGDGVAGENLELSNAVTGGDLTFEITNNGATDIELNAFHFDAYAFRSKAARTYTLSVLPGGDITDGVVYASGADEITNVNGAWDNGAHDDIDHSLLGLADHTLGAGESVRFLLAFSGGAGDTSGGHDLWVDNVAVTHLRTVTPVAAPQVNAGLDASVTLPENQVDLAGTATDNGTVASYFWTQLSGPNTASLTGKNTASLSVGDLVQGTYTFRLSATDDEGNIGSDDVSVVVIPELTAFAAVTSFSLINADTDQPITGFDPISNGATINKATVGTTSFNIRVNTSPATDFGSVVMALSGATTKDTTESVPVWALFGDIDGDYRVGSLNDGAHTITATPYDQDAGAGEAGDPLTINFTVTNQTGAPTADAGPDRVVNVPINSVTLNGSGTDDGSISAYIWTQISGPSTAALSNDDTEDLTASTLVEGTYVFRLTVTDNESNQAFDDVIVSVVTPGSGSVVISGELKQWHKLTLMMDGPNSSETATPNPFSDYRMLVTFTHPDSGLSYVVPGYFAADGNAANTSATSGNKWAAHLSPDHVGTWNYTVSFRTGSDVALNDSPTAGTAVAPYDNTSGSFTIAATDKTGPDLRGKGRLTYVGKHHLQFAGNGEYFLKAGTDAPENLLAYDDIDATPNDQKNQPNLRKSWSPHAGDYDASDAAAYTWSGGKGSELLGAIKYLSDKGVNVFSFLTFGLDGDDDNVFPHLLRGSVADYESVADNARWADATKGVHHDRFDISKMSQWEKIFEYGGKKGMYLHFKTQETENDQRMDGGALGRERKLYYRELIARYGHHLALNWNLGEENTNSEAEVKAFAQWFHDNDPYRHNVVLHTYPQAKATRYTPMLGNASELTGLSLQTNLADFSNVFPDTLTWVQNSAAAAKPWVVACDEPGDAQHALRPAGDEVNSWVDGRKNALWGNVMAGGAGVEFYFGYQHAESDLTLQDFRSRDGFWDYCRYMLDFFRDNGIPFHEMTNANSLVSGSGNNANRCLAKLGETYVVQLYNGGTHTLNLSGVSGEFELRWLDPRNGGALQQGSVTAVMGGSTVSLGAAPNATTSDWIVLVDQAVVAPDDFGAWMGSFTFPPGADLTAEGDPDGDGRSTWFEYLFGLDPSSVSSVSPITAGLSPLAGTFSYTRRNPALTNFTDYQVWFSEDLAGWMLDETASQIPDGEGEIQQVMVTVSEPLRSADRLFVQIKAVQ